MYEDRSKVSHVWTSGGTRHGADGAQWYDMLVATPWGFVDAYSDSKNSSYRFIYKGYFYYASEERPRTKRGLSVMAGKLVRKWVGAAK